MVVINVKTIATMINDCICMCIYIYIHIYIYIYIYYRPARPGLLRHESYLLAMSSCSIAM